MPNYSQDNKRIAKNTLFLYMRMLLVMAITLYTSRIILQALGIANYGIYSVIGGVIGLIGFVNNSMALSVQRFLSFEIGKKDFIGLNFTFNISLIIHFAIALIIGVGLIAFNSIIVDDFLNIPIDDHQEAKRFFNLTIISTCLSMMTIPFIGLIIAFERMAIFAWISIFEVMIKLGIAFLINSFSGQPLITYGYLLLGASVLTLAIYIGICSYRFDEIKYRFCFDRGTFNRLMNFAGWSSLGEISWAFTIQGTNILLNRFFGVICNAAYGIATQISTATNKFTGSFQTALNPQIIKLYASDDISRMVNLTMRGIRFSYFLVLLIVAPAISGMSVILELWLGEVPEYAVSLCRLILIGVLVDTLSNLFATVAKAYGKIRKYQIMVAIVLFLNFPLTFSVLKLGCPPYSVVVVYCFVSALLIIVRIKLISEMLNKHFWKRYFEEVIIKIFNVSVVTIAGLVLPLYLMEDTVTRLIIITLISFTLIPIAIYFIGTDRTERIMIKEKIERFFR